MHFDLLYMKNLIYLYLWWFQTVSQYGKHSFYNQLFNFKDWSILSKKHFLKVCMKMCLFVWIGPLLKISQQRFIANMCIEQKD